MISRQQLDMKDNSMSTSEPIRHHYIPRFLLRPFSFKEERVLYYDKKLGETSVKNIADVFMAKNLYRDTLHHPEKPTKIEEDFSKYEDRVAKIVKKFLDSDDVLISKEESEALKLFFAIMGFRAQRVKEAFGSNIKAENKKFYGKYLEVNEDYVDLWTRNIGELVNCRSINDVLVNPNIDDPIKTFMKRDVIGLVGTYFAIVQCDETEEFILGDSYPIDVFSEGLGGSRFTLYSVFPISPRRAILQVANRSLDAPLGVLGLTKKSYFQRPRFQQDQDIMKIHVGQMRTEDIKEINKMIFKAATVGIIMKSKKSMDWRNGYE